MDNKINSQMLKGILSGSILLLLYQEELYGYKLSEKLTKFGFTDIPKGTIYPLLLSLEKKEPKSFLIRWRPLKVRVFIMQLIGWIEFGIRPDSVQPILLLIVRGYTSRCIL